MTETVVLEVNSDLEFISVSSWHSHVLSFYLEFSAVSEKVKVAVHSGHSFAARPYLTEQFDEYIAQKKFAALFDVFVEFYLFMYDLLTAGRGDINIVIFICQASMSYSFESITDELVLNFGGFYHFWYVVQITQLARLIDSVSLFVKPFGIVELQALLGRLEEANQKHEGDDGCSSASFSMVAVDGDYPVFCD